MIPVEKDVNSREGLTNDGTRRIKRTVLALDFHGKPKTGDEDQNQPEQGEETKSLHGKRKTNTR